MNVGLEHHPRSFHTLPDGNRLAYIDMGEGDSVVVLLHGWSSSLNWWHANVGELAERHRVIALDWRGHGDSDKSPAGHTMEQYARDLQVFLDGLGVSNVVLVGWSMACFVLWKYTGLFGRSRSAGMVFVGQSARDLRTPDFPHGIVTYEAMHEWMLALQTDQRAFVCELMQTMRKHPPTDPELAWMVREYLRCPAHIATVAFYHQTTVDCVAELRSIDFPTQVHFGTDPSMYNISDGEFLAENIPGTELIVFEESGHIPMIEEPEKFNQTLTKFVQRVQS